MTKGADAYEGSKNSTKMNKVVNLTPDDLQTAVAETQQELINQMNSSSQNEVIPIAMAESTNQNPLNFA